MAMVVWSVNDFGNTNNVQRTIALLFQRSKDCFYLCSSLVVVVIVYLLFTKSISPVFFVILFDSCIEKNASRTHEFCSGQTIKNRESKLFVRTLIRMEWIVFWR